MDIMYTFLVDFARPQRTNELLVMQNDALTRVARFVLMNNGKALDVSDVDAVTINAVLPDESRITAEASLLTDDDDEPLNEIIYAIPASMTSAIGKTVVNISLYSNPENDDPKLLNSFEFYINTRNELNMDDGDDEDDYAGIRDLINRSIEAVALVEQLIARSTLPNPYPLRIILEDTTYNYDGSRMVTVDFGNLLTRIDDLLQRIIALEQAFPDGCRIIARAITAGRGTYTNPINGVPTADNASPTTMATNIKTLAVNNYNQGIADTKAIDPTFSSTWSTRTAGTQATYQTKATNAGWIEVDEVPQTLTSKITAQIDTTGDDQIHDFSIVPDAYHKAKVNQKPAYDAGYAAGFDDATFHGYNVIWQNAGQYIRNENQPNNRPGKELIHTLTFSKDMKYVALFKTVSGKEELMSGGTKVLEISNSASVGTHDNGELKIYQNVPAGSTFTLNMLPEDYTYYDNYSRWMGSWSEAVVELY